MKVLLATDGSSFAEEATWLLAHLPHAAPLELTVLSVVQVPFVPSARASQSWMTQCVESEKSFAKRTFDEVRRMFEGADVTLRHEIREGHLGETIVETARDDGAQLIVLGAKGHSTVDRILLGSTSDYVATHAPCSVMVVRPTGLRSHPERPLHVTFAYDDSPPSRAAIDEIREFRWGGQTTFEVVSVVSFISAFMNEVVIEPNEVKDEATRAITAAAGRLADVAPNARSLLIESDHVAEGIVHHAENEGCDLVVVGDTGHGGLAKALLGSVSRYVLRHVPCSVWISRRATADSKK